MASTLNAVHREWLASGQANRRLAFALLASCIAHAWVLLQDAPRLPDGKVEAPLTLIASLRVPLANAADATANTVERLHRPVVSAIPPLPEPAETQSMPSAPGAVASPALAPTAPMASAALIQPAPAVDAALASAANRDMSASAVSREGLNAYRIALALQARRFKRYPAQARTEGLGGRAEVKLLVGADGRPQAAVLSHSSSHDVLDRAALAMVDASALRVAVPENLRGQAFAVLLPVVFDLSEE